MLSIANSLPFITKIISEIVFNYEFSKNQTYYFAFYGGATIILDLFFIFFPEKYFSSKLKFFGYQDGKNNLQKENKNNDVSIFKLDDAFNPEIKKKKNIRFIHLFSNPSYMFSLLTKVNCMFTLKVIKKKIENI